MLLAMHVFFKIIYLFLIILINAKAKQYTIHNLSKLNLVFEITFFVLSLKLI